MVFGFRIVGFGVEVGGVAVRVGLRCGELIVW